MITDQDITLLKATFATKEQHEALAIKVDGIQETVGDLKVEVGEINEKVDDSLVKLDFIIGTLRTLEQENGAGAAHLERHDRQLTALATSAGITLPN
jgi:hypothetical protein